MTYRKITIYPVILLLMLPILSITAAPLDELSQLARNFPQETPVFFASRTDENFISTIDNILHEIDEALGTLGGPISLPVGFTYQDDDHAHAEILHQALDELALDVFGGDFDETIRPWLGNSIALGLTDIEALLRYEDVDINTIQSGSLSDKPFPILIAAELINREAAITAFESIPDFGLDTGTTLKFDAGDYVLYRDAVDDFGLLITPDAIVFGQTENLLNVIDRPHGTLLDNTMFQQTLSQLPADGYNMVGYMNYGEVIKNTLAFIATDASTDITPQDIALIEPFIDAIAGMAFAGTILDGRTLTLDFVQQVDFTDYEALGFTSGSTTPINPAFANRLPANTALAIFQSDLSSVYDSLLANMLAVARLQEQIDDIPEDERLSEEQINGSVFLAKLAIQTVTGLNLQDDILSWMNSDYALILGLSNDMATVRRFDSLRTFPVEFAILFDATSNPEGAARTLNGLADGLSTLQQQYQSEIQDSGLIITQSRETIGGGDVVVYQLTDQLGSLPFPIEILAGSNDDVFAIGTRDMVQTAMTGDGSLQTTIAYTEAKNLYMLESSNVLMLVNSNALSALADLYRIIDTTNPAAAHDAENIRKLFAIFSSMTISTATDTNGTSISRATISLNLGELE